MATISASIPITSWHRWRREYRAAWTRNPWNARCRFADDGDPRAADRGDALSAAICRWSNIVFGLLYTAIMAMTLPGAAPFYITLAVIEMALTAAIVIAAWTWATAEGGPE